MIIHNTWNKRFSESLVPKLQENLCTRKFIIIRWESPTQVGQINPKSAAVFGALNKSENKRSGISEILVIPVEQWPSRRLTEKGDLYTKHRPQIGYRLRQECGFSIRFPVDAAWKLARTTEKPSVGFFWHFVKQRLLMRASLKSYGLICTSLLIIRE